MSHSALTARLRAAGCVFAEEEADLLIAAADSPRDLEDLAARRCAGEPLEHVVGWAGFCGIRVIVGPGVFVPRPRSEVLVAEAVAGLGSGGVVADLCCGSGAVGMAIATAGDGIELHAADLDPAAVRCARRNLSGVGSVHEGDLYDALPDSLRDRIDLIVANAPYVPGAELATLPRDAREHEPALALDGGGDGLDVHRCLAAGAPGWLKAGGALLVEVALGQVEAGCAAIEGAGMAARVTRSDELDVAVVAGRSPG